MVLVFIPLVPQKEVLNKNWGCRVPCESVWGVPQVWWWSNRVDPFGPCNIHLLQDMMPTLQQEVSEMDRLIWILNRRNWNPLEGHPRSSFWNGKPTYTSLIRVLFFQNQKPSQLGKHCKLYLCTWQKVGFAKNSGSPNSWIFV